MTSNIGIERKAFYITVRDLSLETKIQNILKTCTIFGNILKFRFLENKLCFLGLNKVQ